MNYQEAIHYINHIQKELGSEYTLDDVTRLCESVDRPDRKLRIVHIAGTNGKGSVGTFISNCLAMSGYTVGRYISPALIDYREKIQRITADNFGVNIEYITEEETASWLTLLQEKIQELLASARENQGTTFHQPTAFEIETVMAFLQFRQWHVDVAVVEVGLGGLMDATNIIEKPLVSVFIQIGMDHTGILGDRLVDIATQKYGIIKPGVPVVSIRQELEIMEMLRSLCQRKGNRLRIAEPEMIYQPDYSLEGTEFLYHNIRYRLSQLGTYQVENAILAIETMHELERIGLHKINDECIKQGLKCSRWIGRFEMVSKSPMLILDGAHNPSGALQLKKSLEMYFPAKRFNYIMGVFADKDYEGILDVMLPLAKRVYTVSAPAPRGMSAEVLAETVESHGQKREIPVQSCQNVANALEMIRQSGYHDVIVVFGSLSFLHEVYTYFDTALYI